MEKKEQGKRIFLSSPTMHGDEQRFVQEAFDTNWIAPLGPNVNAFEKECEQAGIHTDVVSPKLLPDYRRKK